MTAIRLVTQFDDPRRRALAVATPTCCSCCCCCCAVTLTTSAALTAVHLNDTAAATAPDRRPMATVLGAVSAPVALGLLLAVGQVPGVAYGVRVALGAFVVAAWLGVLVSAYRLGGHPKPLLPPLVVVGATAAGMAVEFLLIASSGGLGLWAEILAVPVPILAGISLHRKLKARRAPGMGRA
jgi:hypothetical protein